MLLLPLLLFERRDAVDDDKDDDTTATDPSESLPDDEDEAPAVGFAPALTPSCVSLIVVDDVVVDTPCGLPVLVAKKLISAASNARPS